MILSFKQKLEKQSVTTTSLNESSIAMLKNRVARELVPRHTADKLMAASGVDVVTLRK
jgi:hypothetical protein